MEQNSITEYLNVSSLKLVSTFRCILLRVFCCTMFVLFCFFLFFCYWYFILSIFSVWHVSCLYFISFNIYNISSCCIYVHVHISIEKCAYRLEINRNGSFINLWLLFSALFLFLKVFLMKLVTYKKGYIAESTKGAVISIWKSHFDASLLQQENFTHN